MPTGSPQTRRPSNNSLAAGRSRWTRALHVEILLFLLGRQYGRRRQRIRGNRRINTDGRHGTLAMMMTIQSNIASRLLCECGQTVTCKRTTGAEAVASSRQRRREEASSLIVARGERGRRRRKAKDRRAAVMVSVRPTRTTARQ